MTYPFRPTEAERARRAKPATIGDVEFIVNREISDLKEDLLHRSLAWRIRTAWRVLRGEDS